MGFDRFQYPLFRRVQKSLSFSVKLLQLFERGTYVRHKPSLSASSPLINNFVNYSF